MRQQGLRQGDGIQRHASGVRLTSCSVHRVDACCGPRTAGRVHEPAGCRWHGLGGANPLITDQPLYLALAGESEACRAAYRDLFRAHLDEAATADIRKALNRG